MCIVGQVEQYLGGRSHEDLKSYVNTKVEEALGTPFGTAEETIPEQEGEVSHCMMIVGVGMVIVVMVMMMMVVVADDCDGDDHHGDGGES